MKKCFNLAEEGVGTRNHYLLSTEYIEDEDDDAGDVVSCLRRSVLNVVLSVS